MAGKLKIAVTAEEKAFWNMVRVNIKQALKNAKQSQAAFARHLGVTESQVSNHLDTKESSRQRPVENILFAAAQFINIPVHRLLTAEKETDQERIWRELLKEIIDARCDFTQVVKGVRSFALTDKDGPPLNLPRSSVS